MRFIYIVMEFNFSRDVNLSTSRWKKHPIITVFFSYPGFIFTTVYRRFFNQFDCFKKGVG